MTLPTATTTEVPDTDDTGRYRWGWIETYTEETGEYPGEHTREWTADDTADWFPAASWAATVSWSSDPTRERRGWVRSVSGDQTWVWKQGFRLTPAGELA